MTPDPTIKFNGPPPEKRAAGRAKSAFRLALDERPGEWASKEYGAANTAVAHGTYLRRVGYETAVRGTVLYARRPV